MRQQVNLYVDGFETPRQVLSAAQGVALVLASLVVMALVSGGLAMRGAQLQSKAAAAQQKVDQKKTEVETLQAQLDARKPDSALEARASSLERNVQAKQRLIGLVRSSEGGNVDGFSQYLRSLSKQPVPGLWLTNIQIQAGGTLVGFSGQTSRPENVPVFIKSLAREKPYVGRQFEKLQISQSGSGADGSPPLNFDIRSFDKGGRR